VDSYYFSKNTINYSNLVIELNATAWQIDCQIRAYTFRDFQMPIVFGHKIKNSQIQNTRSTVKPGILLEDCENFICVSTIDYDIILYKDRFEELLEFCKNDQIEELRKFNYTNNYITDYNSSGWSLIIVSAYNNSKNALQYLIEIGANINDKNFNGTNVLMYAKDAALKFNDYEIIDIVLSFEPDVFAVDYNNKNIFDYLKFQSIELLNYISKFQLKASENA
jgi:methionyl-tRNA formyltransferase